MVMAQVLGSRVGAECAVEEPYSMGWARAMRVRRATPLPPLLVLDAIRREHRAQRVGRARAQRRDELPCAHLAGLVRREPLGAPQRGEGAAFVAGGVERDAEHEVGVAGVG